MNIVRSARASVHVHTLLFGLLSTSVAAILPQTPHTHARFVFAFSAHAHFAESQAPHTTQAFLCEPV